VGGKTVSKLQTKEGWLIKGADILVRAGTGYDLAVSGPSLIQIGTN